jgi:thioredoxin-dependent peroxiredoxin
MKKAPNFKLKDQNGEYKSLKDYSGKWIVLYFYPKDNTPGCTKEACNFRDAREQIELMTGAVVIGISKDSVASHKKFADKHKLNFSLLSDPEHVTTSAYGAWGPRKFLGREFFGTHRNTYLIDKTGNIVKEYLGVNPTTHAVQLINDLKELDKK